MSFRLRLPLASAAAVALAVAAACAIAYIVVGQRLYGQVDSALRAESAAGAPSGGPHGQIPKPELFSSTDLDYMQAVSATGQIATRSRYVRGRLPITQTAVDAATSPRGSLTLQTMTVQGAHLRVATVALGNGFSLQIARRLTDADVVLSQLRIWFLL